MPELPEVETVRRGLNAAVRGRVITAVTLRRRTLREPLPDDFEARLVGKQIKTIARRGKYLLFKLPSLTWLAHLGMSGSFVVLPDIPSVQPSMPTFKKHAHVVVTLDDGNFLVYDDPRRFGRMTLTDSNPATHPWLRNIGPEPLSPAFSAAVLRQRLNNKSVSIKTALMDARVVAGVGNIYASEALFVSYISPHTVAGSLSAARATRLVAALQTVLRDAIRVGGSTIRNFVGGDGKPGYFQTLWAVYDRAEQPCLRCPGTIRRVVQGGRATYFCPRCQR